MEEAQGPPHVTALIVSRDCAEDLRRCLTALERSIPRDTLEILVVDNGSRDGTASVTDDFSAVTILKLPKNFGRTKALNIGLRTAKGDLVFLMDPSVEVQPETIATLAARMDADENVGAVCPYVERVYPMPSPAELKDAWKSGSLPRPQTVDAESAEVAVDYPMGAPMLVRRAFLKGMNYFDQRFGEHWSDLELCWQLRSAGKKILVLPGVRAGMKAQANLRLNDATAMSDAATGAAAYISKHYGTVAGLAFRVSAALGALTSLNLKLLGGVVAGEKIDGTQA
jgi:GT2 family glycosyltransferase